MKKHVLLAKVLMTLAFTGALTWGSMSSAYAQIASYGFVEGTETYAQITGTTSTATGDDGSQNGVAIGFTFNFGGTDYTTFSINTNGFIRLGANIGGSSWSNNIANANSTQSPVIAAFWDDNNLSTGTIRYTTSGSAPNRVLTVDWNQTKIGGIGGTGGSSNSMQIRLYETTNNIELVYGSTFTTSNTVTAFVGINNAGSFVSVTPGNPSTFSNATQNHDINNTVMQNLAGKKLTFTPPSCVAPSGLNASLVSTTEANFSWNAATPIPGVGYEWAVTTSATPPASGTATAGLTANINTLSANEVYFLHVRSECTGAVFSGWSTFSFMTLEGNDCGFAQDLTLLTSPFTGTTVGFTNNFTNSCLTGTGGDRVFKIDVPNNYALFIGQSVNGYDSRHRIAVGGACPGTTEINTGYFANFPTLTTTGTTAGCLDDSDLTHYYYNNSTGSTQTVYWVQDGHSSGQGTFTLEWQLVELPSVPSCASNIVASQDPNCGNFALTISWDAVATATGYKISMGTTPGGTNIANNQNIGAITAFVINSPQLNTQYFYTVTPYNMAGDAVGCTEGSFTTGSTPCFLPGENCGVAQDLATLTSPFTGTTVGYTDDFNISCISGTATDRIFFMEVPNNHSLFIGQSANNYDSKHRFAVGGACPGDNPINTGYVANFPTQLTDGTQSGCLDDNDLTHYYYNNNTGSTQTVYWLQDGYSSGQGTFTLEWELIENPTAPDCASNFVATPTPGCDNGTISLSWDAAATATGYKITVGTTSGGTDIANNLDLGNVLTVNLTNPELNTTYFFTLVPYNMGGDAVGCAEEQFTTGGIGCHCIPTYDYGKTDGDLISNVEIPGTTLANNTGTAQVNPEFTYFTGQPNYTADLVQGGSYNVTISIGVWGDQAIRAWIDYNDDGVFDDSESIGATTVAPDQGFNAGGYPPAVFNVNLSNSAPLGTHRMRIRSAYFQDASNLSPCALYSFGETEDYDITIVAPVTTQLQPSSCGATNVQMSDVLGAIQVPHGGYRFRIIGANDGSAGWNGNTFILDRPVRNFRFSHVPGSLWGETYSVEVAVGDGFGNYGPYGASCDVTLASLPPTTQLQSSQCNITDVSQTTFLFANQVNNAAGYRFRIIGANNGAQGWTGNTFILDRLTRDFRFSMVPGVIWGETYSVEVAVLSLDNVTYGLYGTACNVTLQATPTTALQSSQCGITNVAQNTALFANTVNGAAGYRFRVVGTNDGSQGWVVDTYILDRPVRNFKFNMIPGVLQGEEYEVQVAVLDANGNYGAYGSVCTITLAGVPDFVINDENEIFLTDKTMNVVEFGASASHNPFTTDFGIQVLNANDSEAINVVIYDMSGKLIESNTVNPMEIESARFGQNLAAGMYMITVVQGSNQAVIRQVKN